MKRKALNKTLKEVLFVFVAVFIITFFSIKFGGHFVTIQPGSAPHKCESITYKEAAKDFPFILFYSSVGSLIYFFLGYEYNLNKLKKEEKLRKMIEEKEEKEKEKEKEEKKDEEGGDV